MGVPIQPAPYCDSYISQISKSNFPIIQLKHLNLKDFWFEREIASKIIPKSMINMSAIESSATIVYARIMRKG